MRTRLRTTIFVRRPRLSRVVAFVHEQYEGARER